MFGHILPAKTKPAAAQRAARLITIEARRQARTDLLGAATEQIRDQVRDQPTNPAPGFELRAVTPLMIAGTTVESLEELWEQAPARNY